MQYNIGIYDKTSGWETNQKHQARKIQLTPKKITFITTGRPMNACPLLSMIPDSDDKNQERFSYSSA
ncbi:MAG: hypothetical protein HFE39_10305 [Clostridiales bacterium]|nr:hypothetical protein [Clostridiales bacterium]